MSEGLDHGLVRELFGRCREAGVDERQALLERAGETHPAEAEEVRALLAECDDVGDFLEPSLGAGAQVGDEVGGFTILRRLGQGGMGIVYEAEQRAPRRTVALKTVRPGVLGPEGLRRFRREAEVMASLEHPAIAEVYASGTDRRSVGGLAVEVSWYAMRLLRGARSITDHCDAEGLDRRARIELVLPVLDGIQHAHDRGILHRDVKAENVLVDGEGAATVIDFGIARASTERLDLSTLETATGRLLGTLRSMSPEQLEGRRARIDERTDVYSLGVLLYELLLGSPPHPVDGLSLPDAVARIRDEPPLRPSRLDPSLRGDLETILLTAVAAEPERRYPSVAALAEDLRRFLDARPIVARAPSLNYRLERFVRRNRLPVVSAVVLLVVALVAVLALVTAKQRGDEADATARDAVEMALARAREQTGALGTRLHRMAGTAEIRRDMLAATIAELETLEAEHPDVPALDVELARAELLLADVIGAPSVNNLGDPEAARGHYARAEAWLEDAPDDDPRASETRSTFLRRWGAFRFGEGDLEEAAALGRRALEVAQDYRRRWPDSPDGFAQLMYGHDAMASITGRLGDREGSARHLEEALAACDGYLAAGGDPVIGRTQRAYLDLSLGGSRWAADDLEAALAAYARAASTFEDLARADPSLASLRVALARARMWEGSAAWRLSDPETAEARLAEAAEGFRSLLEQDPRNAQLPPQLANTYHMLGSVAIQRADAAADDAEERALLEGALAWRERAVALTEDERFADLPALAPIAEPLRVARDEVAARLEGR